MSLFFPHWGAKADDWVRFDNGEYRCVLWGRFKFADGRVRIENVCTFSVDSTEESLKEAGAVVLQRTPWYVYISPVNMEKMFIFHFGDNETYSHEEIMKKCGL